MSAVSETGTQQEEQFGGRLEKFPAKLKMSLQSTKYSFASYIYGTGTQETGPDWGLSFS